MGILSVKVSALLIFCRWRDLLLFARTQENCSKGKKECFFVCKKGSLQGGFFVVVDSMVAVNIKMFVLTSIR